MKNFIKKYYKNFDGFSDFCHNAIKMSNENLSPIFIPSYRNRKGATLLQYFCTKPQPTLFELDRKEFTGTKIYIFVYEDDYIESGYNKLYKPDEVEFVLISKNDFDKYGLEWRSIQPKRHFIQKWAEEHNIDKFTMIDDDLCNENGKAGAFCCGNGIERLVTPLELVKILETIGNETEDWSILSAIGGRVHHSELTMKNNSFCQCIYHCNNKDLVSNNIFFDKKIASIEDLGIYLQCRLKHKNTYVLDGIKTRNQSKVTTILTDDFINGCMNCYIEYYPFVRYVLGNKKRPLLIGAAKEKLNKYLNKSIKIEDLETDESALLLKYSNNKDYNSIIEYLKERKKK